MQCRREVEVRECGFRMYGEDTMKQVQACTATIIELLYLAALNALQLI